jgi:RHS repeat-associated protein
LNSTKITFMHSDKQNSVIAISDAAGTPVQRRGYGVYGGEADKGEVRGTSTPRNDPAQMVGTTSAGTSPHPFGYTGRRWDPDLGLYYYRARWYDPTLGTFLQTDPIGSLDYINLYSYVGAEPGNATDPSGMQSADGLFQGLYMAKIEADGGPRVETQVREQAARDAPVIGAAIAVIFDFITGPSGEGAVAVGAAARTIGAAGDVGLAARGIRAAPGTRVRPEGVPAGWRIEGTKTKGGDEIL